MSPIFVRPVREQLEHDRLIRFLLTRSKKKGEATANVGDEQVAPVKIGQNVFYPDLVLTAGKKLTGLIEVESGESVNNLEAMAQWVHFSRARVPFYLYVPVTAYDVARRLCEANAVRVTELWTYRPVADGFDLMRGFHDASAGAGGTAVKPKKPVVKPGPPAKPGAPAKSAAKPAKSPGGKRPAARPASKPAKVAKPRKAAKKGRKR